MHRAIAIAAVVIAGLIAGTASAGLTHTAPVGGNTVTYDVLDPATSLGAAGGPSASLSWTATPDTYASGHRVLRGTVSGGPYTQVAEITPRTTTTYVDSPVAGTYYYVARAYFQSWESLNSNEASATVSAGFLDCSANAAVTTSSGDNNGFQTTPGNACADDASAAQDVNSGTTTTVSCTSTGKDRHRYYDYGITVPAGSTLNGIEVRLDAWADSTSGAPFMCVDLSWNGGTTWTAAKSTAGLTTAQATYTLGSTSDLWGRTWAISEFTNANFRVRITNVASNNNRDFNLDWVSVRVSATPP